MLEKNSMENKYYVEYMRFRANHLSHAIIALYDIGAPIDHIEKYAEVYGKRIEPKGGPLNKTQDAKSNGTETIEELLGKRTRFYDLLSHYKKLAAEKYGNSIDKLIQGEFPRLSTGICCSALHPLIHIGYGYSVSSLTVVCEGLAYLHHAYTPFKPVNPQDLKSFGKGTKDVLEVLEDMAKNKELCDYMLSEADADWVQANLSYFQDRLKVLFMTRADQLIDYAHEIKGPKNDLAGWLIDKAIELYLSSTRSNEFFFLHGVTASWALKQFVHLLDDPVTILRIHTCQLLAVYLVEMKPPLDKSRLQTPKVDHLEWKDLINKVLEKPVESTDEHTYKLIQVCHQRSQVNPDMDDVYKRAAVLALEAEAFTLGRTT